MASECLEQRRDECIFKCLGLYDGSTTATALCAGVGVTDQWSHRSIDESNADVERLDGSDSVSGTGIGEFQFFDYRL